MYKGLIFQFINVELEKFQSNFSTVFDDFLVRERIFIIVTIWSIWFYHLEITLFMEVDKQASLAFKIF